MKISKTFLVMETFSSTLYFSAHKNEFFFVQLLFKTSSLRSVSGGRHSYAIHFDGSTQEFFKKIYASKTVDALLHCVMFSFLSKKLFSFPNFCILKALYHQIVN